MSKLTIQKDIQAFSKKWLRKGLFTVAMVSLFVIIVFFTWRGRNVGQNSSYDNLMGVLVSTTGTVIAIFFSLVLIPLNQIAARYSPSFLKHLKKDSVFITTFVFSTLTLVYDLFFLVHGTSKTIAFLSSALFILLVFLLGQLLFHIIKLSNPYESILRPAHKEIVKQTERLIKRYKSDCETQIAKTLGDNKHLNDSVDICSFAVDERVTNYIESGLLPMREVALKAIRDLDLEQAKNSIQTMMSVVVNYLILRKDYHSDNDPLLYFIYTEYKTIIQESNNALKIQLHPFLADCWSRIGVQAAIVNVKGMKRMNANLNGLVSFPVLGLKELCALNLPEMDSYASGKACEALGDIGVRLMTEGYDHQASEVVKELVGLSLVADQYGMKNISGSANYAIMRIYVAGVSSRNLGGQDQYNFPYRQINKDIDNLLTNLLQKKRNTIDNLVLSSFIGDFIDPFKGLCLSRISEFGIFTQGLNAEALESNLQCVKANINSLKICLSLLAKHDDWYFSGQALDNLYGIARNLLAYINEPMAKDQILFYKLPHPQRSSSLEDLSNQAFIDSINVLVGLVKARADRYIYENDHLHILFSLYLILLYETKVRSGTALEGLFKIIHQTFIDLLSAYKQIPDVNDNDDAYKYYRLLKVILEKNSFHSLSNNFVVPTFVHSTSGIIGVHESEYPKTVFDNRWILKRPMLQVNANYFNSVETKLQIDKITFF